MRLLGFVHTLPKSDFEVGDEAMWIAGAKRERSLRSDHVLFHRVLNELRVVLQMENFHDPVLVKGDGSGASGSELQRQPLSLTLPSASNWTTCLWRAGQQSWHSGCSLVLCLQVKGVLADERRDVAFALQDGADGDGQFSSGGGFWQISKCTTPKRLSGHRTVGVHGQEDDLDDSFEFRRCSLASRPFSRGMPDVNQHDVWIQSANGVDEGLSVVDDSDDVKFGFQELFASLGDQA